MSVTRYLVLLFLLLSTSSTMAQSQEGRTLYSIDSGLMDLFPASPAITIDVFWCTGDASDASRQIVGSEIAASIATYAKLTNPTAANKEQPEYLLRSVRVRPISLNDSNLLNYSIGKNSIQFSDQNLLLAAMRVSAFSGSNLTALNAEGLLPNYIKVVACEKVDIQKVAPRVFFQIVGNEQADAAKLAIAAISTSFNNVRVSQALDVVGDLAPNKTEVRYFFASDKTLAEGLQKVVGETIADQVNVKFFSRLAQTTSEGTIEVWIGKAYKPQKTSEYYVCTGEFPANCPAGSQWTTCGTSIDEWAKTIPACSKFQAAIVSDASGNKCGYAVSRVTCIGQ